ASSVRQRTDFLRVTVGGRGFLGLSGRSCRLIAILRFPPRMVRAGIIWRGRGRHFTHGLEEPENSDGDIRGHA
ncbi:hypothetical protein GOODEAATRI_025143, partial [Goodea atripinnis]